jgi:hypothetical protein
MQVLVAVTAQKAANTVPASLLIRAAGMIVVYADTAVST